MKIYATIKVNDNGYYEIYSCAMVGDFEIDGYGKTEEQAKADFMNAVTSALTVMRDDNGGVLPPEWQNTTVEYRREKK